MITHKLTLSPKANNDLADIYRHTQQRWGQLKADAYVDKINDTFNLILRNEHIGKNRSDVQPNLRSLLLGAHVIFYRPHRHSLLIVRILHQSMDVDAQLLQ